MDENGHDEPSAQDSTVKGETAEPGQEDEGEGRGMRAMSSGAVMTR